MKYKKSHRPGAIKGPDFPPQDVQGLGDMVADRSGRNAEFFSDLGMGKSRFPAEQEDFTLLGGQLAQALFQERLYRLQGQRFLLFVPAIFLPVQLGQNEFFFGPSLKLVVSRVPDGLEEVGAEIPHLRELRPIFPDIQEYVVDNVFGSRCRPGKP